MKEKLLENTYFSKVSGTRLARSTFPVLFAEVPSSLQVQLATFCREDEDFLCLNLICCCWWWLYSPEWNLCWALNFPLQECSYTESIPAFIHLLREKNEAILPKGEFRHGSRVESFWRSIVIFLEAQIRQAVEYREFKNIAIYLLSYLHFPLLLGNMLLFLNFVNCNFHELHCRNEYLRPISGSS